MLTTRAVRDAFDLSQESATAARTSFWYGNATRAQLLGVAQRLYRLAMAQLRGEPRELEQLDATLSVAARVTRLLELAASSAAQQKLLPWSEPPMP